MEPLNSKMPVKKLIDPESPLKEPLDPEIRAILQLYSTYPLHKASEQGHAENVEKLLEYGFPPSPTNFDCYTPLHEACNQGHLKCAELLIRYGAKVNATSIDGATPLCDACSSGHVECVRLLMSHGALVNPPLLMTSPLHEACLRGSLDCAAILINAGARLNSNDCNHGTPLHAATKRNNVDCIRILLQAGAPVNDAIFHETPLHIAAANYFYEAGCVLLEFGANVYASNNQNRMPIELLKYRCGPFYKMLAKYAVTPSELKDLCRRKIRSLCGTKCITLIEKLNLPQPLYLYLMYLPQQTKFM